MEKENKRARISAACNSCHRKKAKCDGERPSCSACIKSNQLCSYERASKKHINTLNYLTSIEERLAKANEILMSSLNGPEELPPSPEDSVVPLEMASHQLDKASAALLDLFFEKEFHLWFYLDLPHAEAYWRNAACTSPLLVCAISCHSIKYSDPHASEEQFRSIADGFYFQANEIVTKELAKPPSSSLIFGLLLLADYAYLSGRSSSAFQSVAIHVGVQMKINVEYSSRDRLSEYEKEVRRRLWWICVLKDIELAISKEGYFVLSKCIWKIRFPRIVYPSTATFEPDFLFQKEIELELGYFIDQYSFIPPLPHVKTLLGYNITINAILHRIYTLCNIKGDDIKHIKGAVSSAHLESSLLEWRRSLPEYFTLEKYSANLSHSSESLLLAQIHLTYYLCLIIIHSRNFQLVEKENYELPSIFKTNAFDIICEADQAIKLFRRNQTKSFHLGSRLLDYTVFKCGEFAFELTKGEDKENLKLIYDNCLETLKLLDTAFCAELHSRLSKMA